MFLYLTQFDVNANYFPILIKYPYLFTYANIFSVHYVISRTQYRISVFRVLKHYKLLYLYCKFEQSYKLKIIFSFHHVRISLFCGKMFTFVFVPSEKNLIHKNKWLFNKMSVNK